MNGLVCKYRIVFVQPAMLKIAPSWVNFSCLLRQCGNQHNCRSLAWTEAKLFYKSRSTIFFRHILIVSMLSIRIGKYIRKCTSQEEVHVHGESTLYEQLWLITFIGQLGLWMLVETNSFRDTKATRSTGPSARPSCSHRQIIGQLNNSGQLSHSPKAR